MHHSPEVHLLPIIPMLFLPNPWWALYGALEMLSGSMEAGNQGMRCSRMGRRDGFTLLFSNIEKE